MLHLPVLRMVLSSPKGSLFDPAILAVVTRPENRSMTQQEAMIILTPPLKFGDLEAIKAADLIALYETAVALVGDTEVEYACDECLGDGVNQCACPTCGHEHEHTCFKCDGSGTEKIDLQKADEKTLRMVIETETDEN